MNNLIKAADELADVADEYAEGNIMLERLDAAIHAYHSAREGAGEVNTDGLKPCPFCGSSAEWNHGTYGDGAKWRFISCSCCECQAPAVSREGWSKDRAIAAWNARSALAE